MREAPSGMNRMPDRYREVAVATVDVPLTEAALRRHFLGREAYRRTAYLVSYGTGGAALLAVGKASPDDLFSPITRVELLADPAATAVIQAPDVDLGVPSQVCGAALAEAPGARCVIVHGRYEHVSFILDPAPIRVRLAEVAPPWPPKLLDQACRVLAVAEELPPITLQPEIFDLVEIAAAHPAERYLFPCRGSGIAPEGSSTYYLDERPPRRDWLLIGCERSRQIHRHFYGDEPPGVEMCPRELVRPGQDPVLTKCCGLETGVIQDGAITTVPWGATLDEVREGFRTLVSVHTGMS